MQSPITIHPGATGTAAWSTTICTCRTSANRTWCYTRIFAGHIMPDWVDKAIPWRRAPNDDSALDHMILVSPSPAFVASLPNGKLPNRRDFPHYGQDHALRMRNWCRAIAESKRMAASFARWAEQPDLRQALDL